MACSVSQIPCLRRCRIIEIESLDIHVSVDSLIKVACAVYPAADIEVDTNGLVLKPSRPPVAPKQIGLSARDQAQESD
jgi:hypothetical protein